MRTPYVPGAVGQNWQTKWPTREENGEILKKDRGPDDRVKEVLCHGGFPFSLLAETRRTHSQTVKRSGRCARATLLLAAVLAGSLCSHSAEPQVDEPVPIERDFTVRVWRKEHGLPDDRVLSLLRDRRGFLWIGTRKGVSRFDGRNFMTWSRSSHAAFTSEECRALAEDRDGVIWVGTEDGLVRLGDSLTHHPLSSVTFSDRASPYPYESRVTDLMVTPENELLVATTAGLVRRSPAGRWRRQRPEHEVLFALAQTPDGVAWVGSALCPYPLSDAGPTAIPSFPEPMGQETACVHALAVTRDGTVYASIGSWPGGFGRLFRCTSTGWQRVSDEVIGPSADPRLLFADSTGGLWHSLNGGRLVRREGERRTVYQLPNSLREHASLCMAQDHEGNLWVGMDRKGLFCLQPRAVQTVSAQDGLKDNNVWTLLQAADGALWVGTDSGVTRFKQIANGRFHATMTLDSKDVRALAEDREGRLWTGTRSGLQVRAGRDLEEPRFPGEWFHTKVRALHSSRDGAVWVATAVGVHCLRGDQTNSWRAVDGLPHDDVRVILEDRTGRIWLGTDGGGLARRTETGFERFDESTGLSSSRVWALHEDAEGALWIGTDRGLNCLRQGGIRVLTKDQGLPENLVNGIVEDARGYLWIGHDLGIYRVARDDLIAVMDGKQSRARCIAYDEEDGLPGVETNGQISYPPVIALRDGRLAFATVAGVALFDPSHPPDITDPPPAHIERLSAAGETLFVGYPSHPSRNSINDAREFLRVPPTLRGIIEIHFTAPAFRAPEKVRFRHRLLGLSADWTDAGTLHQASYAHLPAGNYTFEVAAVNKHGYWSTTPARLALRLESRWHERVSVRAGAALGLALLMCAGARRRLHAIRRLHRLEKQAARAEERARLAKDLHDTLGSDLTELTLLSNLGERVPSSPDQMAHRFKQLSRRTHEALHSLRDLIWTTHPRADSLEELAARLCEHSERLLQSAGINCRLDLPVNLPEVMLDPDVRRNLLLATHEAVHNAVRHARPTKVWLRLRAEGDRVEVTVEDNGCGFDPAGVAQQKATDHGIGLASMRERVAVLGGRCLLTSRPGQGTRVTFRVPLPPA